VRSVKEGVYGQIRVVEIQKMEQRSKSKTTRLTAEELAADAWDCVYFKDQPPLSEWLGSNRTQCSHSYSG